MKPEWVIPGILAKSARPGRELGRDLKVPKPVVDSWIEKVKTMGIKSIICLLEKEQMEYFYEDLPRDLLSYYRENGFEVAHIPLSDPEKDPRGWKVLEKNLEKTWQAFQSLPKPVLVHCSAGKNRSERVAKFICDHFSQA